MEKCTSAPNPVAISKETANRAAIQSTGQDNGFSLLTNKSRAEGKGTQSSEYIKRKVNSGHSTIECKKMAISRTAVVGTSGGKACFPMAVHVSNCTPHTTRMIMPCQEGGPIGRPCLSSAHQSICLPPPVMNCACPIPDAPPPKTTTRVAPKTSANENPETTTIHYTVVNSNVATARIRHGKDKMETTNGNCQPSAVTGSTDTAPNPHIQRKSKKAKKDHGAKSVKHINPAEPQAGPVKSPPQRNNVDTVDKSLNIQLPKKIIPVTETMEGVTLMPNKHAIIPEEDLKNTNSKETNTYVVETAIADVIDFTESKPDNEELPVNSTMVHPRGVMGPACNMVTLVSALRLYRCQSVQQPNAMLTMIRMCIRCGSDYIIACENIASGASPINLSLIECPRCWNSNACYCGRPFSDRYVSGRD